MAGDELECYGGVGESTDTLQCHFCIRVHDRIQLNASFFDVEALIRIITRGKKETKHTKNG